MPPLIKAAWSITTAGLLALVGWVYSTTQRVAVVEANAASANQRLQEIHDDVRDLRNSLLGPRHP